MVKSVYVVFDKHLYKDKFITAYEEKKSKMKPVWGDNKIFITLFIMAACALYLLSGILRFHFDSTMICCIFACVVCYELLKINKNNRTEYTEIDETYKTFMSSEPSDTIILMALSAFHEFSDDYMEVIYNVLQYKSFRSFTDRLSVPYHSIAVGNYDILKEDKDCVMVFTTDSCRYYESFEPNKNEFYFVLKLDENGVITDKEFKCNF